MRFSQMRSDRSFVADSYDNTTAATTRQLRQYGSCTTRQLQQHDRAGANVSILCWFASFNNPTKASISQQTKRSPRIWGWPVETLTGPYQKVIFKKLLRITGSIPAGIFEVCRNLKIFFGFGTFLGFRNFSLVSERNFSQRSFSQHGRPIWC